jgi:hypothetical protein
MTEVDQPLADKIPSILGPRAPGTRLGYTEVQPPMICAARLTQRNPG